MNKKGGFTLVELLGVFVFLGIVALITIPFVTGMLSKTKKETSQRFEDNVFLATEAYIQDNSDDYTELETNGGTTNILFKDLIDSGYLNKNMVDPTSKQSVKDLNYSVHVEKTVNGFTYTINY